MANASRFRFSAHMMIGLIVIAFGSIFLLGNLDLIEVRDYLRYWPVSLILLGLPRAILPSGSPGRKQISWFAFSFLRCGVHSSTGCRGVV